MINFEPGDRVTTEHLSRYGVFGTVTDPATLKLLAPSDPETVWVAWDDDDSDVCEYNGFERSTLIRAEDKPA